MKKCYWCFREKGLSLVALLLQGKEVMGCFAGDGGGSAVVLSEQVEVVAHLVSGGLISLSLQILRRRFLERGDIKLDIIERLTFILRGDVLQPLLLITRMGVLSRRKRISIEYVIQC